MSIIEEIIKILEPLARPKNLQISLEGCREECLIFGDTEKLKLVLENLMSNAVKYTPSGGKIEIRLAKDGGRAVFSVKDNGVGIPESQQKRVFEKFFRGDNVVKHQTEGTGLGLYIAKNIIEQSGGKIWFKSREDEGTTFFFSLPLE